MKSVTAPNVQGAHLPLLKDLGQKHRLAIQVGATAVLLYAGWAAYKSVPPMLDAARAYATLGEIRSTLEEIYGRFKEPIGF